MHKKKYIVLYLIVSSILFSSFLIPKLQADYPERTFFGVDSEYASAKTICSWLGGTKYEWIKGIKMTANGTGTANFISAYVKYVVARRPARCALIYGSNGTLLAETEEKIIDNTAFQWINFNFTNTSNSGLPRIVENVDYYIVIYGDSNTTNPGNKNYLTIAGVTDSGEGYQQNIQDYPNFPATFSPDVSNVNYSIYCNFSKYHQPNMSSPSPPQGDVGVEKKPDLSIDVSDVDGNLMNITWQHATGSLLDFIDDGDSVMFIQPHSDDEVFSPGLFVYLHDKGNTVWDVSTGMVKNMGDDHLEDSRNASLLWFNQTYLEPNGGGYIFLNHSYPSINDIRYIQIKPTLKSKIEELQPDILITFTPYGYFGNTDHQLVSQMVSEIYPTLTYEPKLYYFINMDEGVDPVAPDYEYQTYPSTDSIDLDVTSVGLGDTYWNKAYEIWEKYNESVTGVYNFINDQSRVDAHSRFEHFRVVEWGDNWVTFDTSLSKSNGTYSPTNLNWSRNGSTEYWWRVKINDGTDYWNNQTYNFTTQTNVLPSISSPNITNGQQNLSITNTTELNITINDDNGEVFNWTIQTSPDVGSNNSQNATNGTKKCTISGLAYDTEYTWWVNATDGDNTTSEVYTFRTDDSDVPVVQTDPVTNIQTINFTLNGLIISDKDTQCFGRFEWGNTTLLFNHTTSNQTLQSGDEYTVSVRGDLSSWYDSNWLYRKEIVIDGENFIDGNLTNFPILVNNTDSDFSLAQSDGDDFLFTLSDGTTKLNHQIELFTQSPGLNQLIAWVNVTNITKAGTTSIYLYWCNSGATDQSNSVGVWDNNTYVAVYHMDEESGSIMYDSTSNQYHANYSGTNTRVTGRVGYGQHLDAGDYITLPFQCYYPIMESGSGGGYSAQISCEGYHPEDDNMVLFYVHDTTNQNRTYTWFDGQYGKARAYANGTSSWSQSATEYNIGQYFSPTLHRWLYHGHFYHTGAAHAVYDPSPSSYTGEETPSDEIPRGEYQKFYFGKTYGWQGFSGEVDEIRIYEQHLNLLADSSCWLRAEGHSVNCSTNFITYYERESEYSDTGNVTAGTLYLCRAVANNTDGESNGDTVVFLTKPKAPELLVALTENGSAMQLTWTQLEGSGYNTTYIERSTSSIPWTLGNGTEVYNGTELITNDTGLEWGTTYYYQAWSSSNWTWNTTTYHQYSTNFDSAYNSTNSMPVFSNIEPENNSRYDSGENISITINDPDGDTFNYTVEWDPPINSIGEMVGNVSEDGQTNKTVTISINTTYNETYTWYVNCTDGYDWHNASYVFTSIVRYVNPPSNAISHYHETAQYLNFSWTNHSDDRENNYIVIQRNDSFSVDVNQTGNWMRQNNSCAYFNVSWTQTSGGYFTIYSWNRSANMYSRNFSIMHGTNVSWGALRLSVFNESNPTQGLTFNVEISNDDSTDVYVADDLTNPTFIDVYDIPYGEDTIFVVTSTGYHERIAYHDLTVNNLYNLTWYLPPYQTPTDPGGGDPGEGEDGGGGNFTTTRLYRLRVIDDYTYPVSDAEVQIRKYINVTGKYENITIVHTDGYGEADVWLIPGDHYRAFVSKTDYETAIFDWIPDPVFYGANYPKIFQIYLTTDDVVNYTFWDLIIFNATINEDGTINIVFEDTDRNTTNAQFYTYELYNYSKTLIDTNSTTNHNITIWVDDVNISRVHEVVIYLNHSKLGFVVVYITVLSIDTPVLTETDIERKIENVIGPFKLGYVHTFLLFLPIIGLLVLPGAKHPGFAIISAALYAGFFTSIVVVGSVLLFVPFLIAIGVILMAVKKGVISL